MQTRFTRPIRTVLRWQLIATAVLVVVSWFWVGGHGATSAFLGGLVSIVSGVVFAVIGSTGRVEDAGSSVLRVLGAEAAKILAIVVLLALVFVIYRDVVAAGFIGTFIVTTIIFAGAIFVREK